MKTKTLFLTVGAVGVLLLSLVSCGQNTNNSEPEGKNQKIWTYSMNKICKEWEGRVYRQGERIACSLLSKDGEALWGVAE